MLIGKKACDMKAGKQKRPSSNLTNVTTATTTTTTSTPLLYHYQQQKTRTTIKTTKCARVDDEDRNDVTSTDKTNGSTPTTAQLPTRRQAPPAQTPPPAITTSPHQLHSLERGHVVRDKRARRFVSARVAAEVPAQGRQRLSLGVGRVFKRCRKGRRQPDTHGAKNGERMSPKEALREV